MATVTVTATPSVRRKAKAKATQGSAAPDPARVVTQVVETALVALTPSLVARLEAIHDRLNPRGPKGGRKYAEWSSQQMVALALDTLDQKLNDAPWKLPVPRPAIR